MDIVRRSITSISWNFASNITKLAVLFARSVLLARLLPVEVFGIYGFAGSIIALTVTLANFGLDSAFIHRSPETEHEATAASIHFTLKAIMTILWAMIIIAFAITFATGIQRSAIIFLTIATAGNELTQTPKIILIRRIVHRRLAIVNLLNAILTTAVSVSLAWNGITLGALLATDFATMLLNIFAFYIWKPFWKPKFLWIKEYVRYFLSYGWHAFIANLFNQALDEVDDIYTGAFIGKLQLGYYSRAYVFATYPRQLISVPVNTVSAGTYAELKNNRRSLSQAFFRTNALLVRTNFLIAGMFFLVAPEFIRLVLGVKWMPMLTTFRLMLIFTLLDPIRITVANIFLTQGKPEILVRVRLIQLIVLLLGLIGLGSQFGIDGVALAMDGMLLLGMVIMFRRARQFVDFSAKQLFGFPTIGLILGFMLGSMTLFIPYSNQNDWVTGFIKGSLFAIAYTSTLLLLEYGRIRKMFSWFFSIMKRE